MVGLQLCTISIREDKRLAAPDYVSYKVVTQSKLIHHLSHAGYFLFLLFGSSGLPWNRRVVGEARWQSG